MTASRPSELSLLTRRRFAPLFVTNVLDAFNDNLFKTALLVLASYVIYRGDTGKAAMLATIATGLFILPFFLFSGLAGEIADAFERSRLVRLVKVSEVAIMALGLYGFANRSAPVLLVALFLMGVHSAFYGPLKYAILPLQLDEDELLGGTGVMEAGGFIAILGGQLFAGVVAAWVAGVVACVMACLGLAASLAILPARPAAPGGRIDLNIAAVSWRLVRTARAIRPVWLSILAIAWFYAVGAVLLGELIPLVKGMLHARQDVAVLFLAIFSVGVALGSLVVNRLLKGEISARYVPISALLLAALLIDLALALGGYRGHGQDVGVGAFLVMPGAFRIVFDLAAISVCGGVFVIPLYTILQTRSPDAERSRILAANNIVNAAITVAAIVVAAVLLQLGVGIAGLIALMGAATLVVAGYACVLLPETVVKTLVRAVLKLLYRVELKGAEHMPEPGTGAVVVVNHQSYLDGLVVAVFLPGSPTFVLHTAILNAWWMRPVRPFINALPVDHTSPLSVKAMVKAVRDGHTLVIFPEGRITVTGALMKVFAGPAVVADKADAPITAVRIDGTRYTRFSLMKGKLRRRAFPKVRLTVLAPQRLALPEGLGRGRKRRTMASARLYDIMSGMILSTSDTDRTLFQAVLDARAIHGRKAFAVEDANRRPLTYDGLVIGSRLLGGRLQDDTTAGEAVGVMLPNVNAAVVAFFALQSSGRVPAMLNYTAGPASLKVACDVAKVATVVTARAFVEQAKLQAAVQQLEASGRRIVWLEDVAAAITTADKLRALLSERVVARFRARQTASDTPAVVLFTSGTEGAPKGVVLTHRNMLSNIAQVASRIDFNPTDKVLNALPIFHSFGLTGALLLPLINGVRTLLYANPLHYAAIPAFAYDASATILFGSDTFLAGYAKKADPYDFYSLRYIFAGAEPVKAETRAVYNDKFGLRLLEGYGATECSPVIAVNSPMRFKAGSVGQLLPGIEARLEPVEGIEEGGRLVVRGPNVMAGYFLADAPGVLRPPKNGWHDTGDVVTLDDMGFVTITGRVKRFAKIGGEMVSLAAVEGYAASLWPEAAHAVVARPGGRKGEELVLFTTQPQADAKALLAWAREHGVAELAVPRQVRPVELMPKLGTGKPDYVTMNTLARKAEPAPEAA